MLNCRQLEKVSSGITGGLTVFRGPRKAAFLLFILAMVFSMAGAALGDLEAHWEFDESSGTSASDSAGSNTGTLYNMTNDDWVSGYLNNALDFDGGNDYVSVPDSDSISVGNGDFTIKLWAYPHTTGDGTLVSKVHDSAQKEYSVSFDDQKIQVDIERSGNNGTAITSANVLSVNEWQHIVVTYDVSATDVDIYVDGIPQSLGTDTIGLPSTTQSDALNIGRRGGSYNNNYYDGLIDDVKIYDSLEAPPQPTIYNTGVDNNGDALGDRVEDPHWTLTTSADGTYDGPETYTVKSDEFPIGPWIANTSDSKWICPRNNGTQVEDGAYVYELEFDLTGYDPDTAIIDGRLATDDSLSNIKINGVSTNISESGFDAWDDFEIDDDFQSGTNTLEFFVNNGGSSANPSGLRVEMKVYASPVSTPSKATSPTPSNSATNVTVTTDLSWTAGSGATSHDVYFGEDSTPDSSEFKGNQGGTTYDTGTMSNDTTYYWRIDEVNASGTTTGDVWSFTTVVAAPGAATNPTPANSATNVAINTDLSWSAGTGAASHDVYFGQDSTPDSGEFQGNQGGTSYDTGTMSNDTTYYWRIDEVNAGGTTTGTVWSFTTIVAAPGQASNPTPSNSATGVGIDADLSWTAGSGATSHDVYFGASSPGAYQGNQGGTTFDPGQMAGGTTYYWRIDEVNIAGTTTGTVWNFTTASAPTPATNPTPANGATSVTVTTDLSWTAGTGASSHNVYFGTDSTPDSSEYQGNQGGTTYDTGTMSNGTVYYWRIDEVNAYGTTTGYIWSFTTGTVPSKATNPSPSDSATDVIITADLSWTAATGATSYDVYFGQSSPGSSQGNQAGTTYDTGTMSTATTYYWRIDPVNAHGTTTGDVWSFTTGSPPAQATSPTPANSATDVAVHTNLSWTAGSGAASHDVYFGEDSTPDSTEFQGNQAGTIYDPGTLSNSTTYYWRIDEINAQGTTTGTVWSFTTTAGAATIEKGPYLIYEGNNTQMTVLWQIDIEQGCSIEWGTTTSYTDGSADTTEYGSDHQHKHTITGLTPGTKYYYRVSVSSNQYTGSFRAAPASNATSVKILAFGDTRTNTSDFASVCAEMTDTYEADPACQTLTLLSGDWVYDGEVESDWTNQFFNRNYSDLLTFQADMPINGCLGNHEWNGGASPPTLLDKYFPYPFTSSYYWSFDYGPVHIAVLDQYDASYSAGSAQYNWLESDLANTTREWKVIVLHEPGYSADGTWDNNADVQTYIQPLCEAYDVDMVIAGHNHYYARCSVNGVKHITTGGGGAPLGDPDLGYPYLETATKALHFCRININGQQLVLEAVKPDGTLIDSFVIDHGAAVPLTISNLSPSAYNVVYDALNAGQIQYVDRDYTYDTVPAAYQGKTFIQTENDDKDGVPNNSITFDIDRDCTVYVAHDDRIPRPTWLTSNFTDTGDNLVAGEVFSLFAKEFDAGTVNLYENNGNQPDASMYTVVVIPKVVTTPPEKATSPTPANGSSYVSPTAILSWAAGDGTASHDVYFGTDSSPDSGEYQGNQADTTFNPGLMDPETTYYWRIDELNAYGTTTGDVWNFTTAGVADLEISMVEPNAYEVKYDSFNVGELTYIDRTYTFTNVASLAGETYIKTANDDKYKLNEVQFVFNINQDCTVYVAFDDEEISPNPDWLGDFTYTGETVSRGSDPYYLYAKDFDAGTVVLGGNSGGVSCSMYFVIVVPKGTGLIVRPEVLNDNFEYPDVSGYQYYPSGSDWSYTGSFAIADSGSAFGNTTWEGNQAMVMQGQVSVWQNVTGFEIGKTYVVRWAEADRAGAVGDNSLRVWIDNTIVGAQHTVDDENWDVIRSTEFVATSNTHTLKFETLTSGDHSAFIDAVSVCEYLSVKDWLRSRPFIVYGLNLLSSSPGCNNIAQYTGAGMNSLMAWFEGARTPTGELGQAAKASAAGLPWHAAFDHRQGQYNFQYQANIAGSYSGQQAVLVTDEPFGNEIDGMAKAAYWHKRHYPTIPLHSNNKGPQSSQDLWGDGGYPPGYDWDDYMDDQINKFDADALMYDYYPFDDGTSTDNGWWSQCMQVRNKALGAGIPCFVWVQAWANYNHRLPSESDVRMYDFVHLAAGYQGIGYFTYDNAVGDTAILDAADNPTALYYDLAEINPEIITLGHCLRYLTSQAVRFVPGEYSAGYDNSTPSGWTDWSSGAGGDNNITNVDVDHSQGGTYGSKKNGVIGFFTDDAGEKYFMLTNTNHAANTDPEPLSVPFIIDFDDETTLLELDRTTGDTKVVTLTNHRLSVTLLGGCGRLYKYNTGVGFAPEGEPAAASNPIPVNGATGVDFDADLSWTAGSGADSHDVYFGTDSTPDAGEFKVNQTSLVYNPGTMAANTTYYWRIDEINTFGTKTGAVWSFTTETSGTAPTAATNPSPDNGATGVVATDVTLSWTAGTGATSRDVYFGVDSTPDSTEYKGEQTGTTYDAGNLSNGTTYYWRIDEINIYGTTTGTVWSFTTGTAPGASSSPSPSNGAVNVGINADLSWTAGSSATTHDVYFGVSSPGSYQGTQASTTFDPGTMVNSTTYYWRIDEVNPHGTTTGTVWSFTTIVSAPGQASGPSPANSATDVDTSADLSWTAGTGASSHDVYFGVSSPGAFQVNQGSTTFDPGTLANSTTYYWRIDEINIAGTTTGTVWSFTTASGGVAPNAAISPVPANSATNVTLDADISWTAGAGATSHDVYFGEDSSPDSSEFKGNQASTSYDPGTLSTGTTYYWRIDEINAYGTTAGSVWSFETGSAPGAAGNPSPANSATDVSLNPTLSWTAGNLATSHDVYFGATSPGIYHGNQTETTFTNGTLTPGTVYYWRIDEINAFGTTTGTVWSFTTGNVPGSASVPTPVNSGVNIEIDTDLAWTAGSGATSHDVYFGTDATPDSSEAQGNQAGTTFDTGTMDYETTYYWRIDEINAYGTTTGSVWSFTTESDEPAVMKLEVGTLSGIGNSWTDVNLPQSYDSMVVVAVANYDSGDPPANIRIQNASGSSFQIRAYEAGGSTPSGLDVHYMVVEEGVYNVSQHGAKMEAVKYTSTVTDEDGSWVGESQSYSNSYTNPIVVGQIMTCNDANFQEFWACGSDRNNDPDGSNLKTGKHVGAHTDTTRADETIGYIVIEDSSGTIGDVNFVADRSSDTVAGVENSPPYAFALSGLNSPEVAIVAQNRMDGGDGGWAILYGSSPLSSSELDIAVDEDQYGDSERAHTTETVGYIVFEPREAPGQAYSPTPADGTTDITVTTDLSWTAGAGATSHDVYFGEDSTPDSTEFQGNQAGVTYDTGTMSTDTTYYWRIDEVNAYGTTAGVVWSFTTGETPGSASNPSPANSATSVAIDADLSWTAGSGADSHDVYFGASSPGTFQGNQAATTFNTGTMNNNTTYYWRIDEVNTHGTTTGTVWIFTTIIAAPGQASSPTPANSATGVGVTTDLSWTAGSGATSHDVYFGVSSPGAFQGNQGGTTFDTGTMNNGTVYYWRIDEVNAGGTTTGVVWNFTTIVAAPSAASSPTPANSATNVDTATDLIWTAGAGATSHDVYFGVDSTPDSSEFQGNQPGTTYDPGSMSNSTTYYWRIDEVNAGGTTTGTVWSFTTAAGGVAPDPATNPSPANGATNVIVTTDLSWTAGAGATSHDVYFGQSSPGASQGNQGGTTFDTGTMSENTTYYWRIDEVNAYGTTTGTVWSFTTGAAAGQASSPTPANSATGVSLNADLSWAAGTAATSHDVYFGTDSSPDSSEYQGNQVIAAYDPGTLTGNTTYYWRIDEINIHGTTTGTVWNFTTGGVPSAASNPIPADNDTDIVLNIDLNWSAGTGATSHDVYFGVDSTPDSSEFQGNQTGTTLDVGTLDPDTEYYWRVDEINAFGTTTGSVWSFTTEVIVPAETTAVAYWALNEASGNTAYDDSGNGNDGTLHNMDDTDWVVGKFGNCLDFDGTNDYITVPDDSTISFGTGSFSIALWVKPEVPGAKTMMVINGTSDGSSYSGKRYSLRYDDDDVIFAIDDNTTKTEFGTSSNFLSDAGWHHVAAVRDRASDQLRIYADGILTAVSGDNTNNSIDSSGENLHIARDGIDSADDYVDGRMDEICLFDYPLTQPQIEYLLMDGEQPTLNINSSDGWDIYTAPSSGYGYRYGASMIINSDDSIDAWFASEGSGGVADYIRHKKSTNGGTSWGSETIALSPTPSSKDYWAVCDPGVIKFGGYYYIGYTACTNNNDGLNNEVYVARSIYTNTGFVKWNGSGWGGNPQPFITYTGTPGQWGCGEPSFVKKGDTLYIYYTWKDGGNEVRVSTADATNANWPGSTTYRGVACTLPGSSDSMDVKYCDDTGTFIGVCVRDRFASNARLRVRESVDGITFGSIDEITEYLRSYAHNCGITGTEECHIDIDEDNRVAYGCGQFTEWGRWDTHMNPIDFDVVTTAPTAPGQVSNPSPANSATNVSINADLSWTAASDATSYDVYFGVDSTPDAGEFQGNQSGTTFDPGVMDNSTTYYWAVDAVNAAGTNSGPTWSFTTEAAAAPGQASSPSPSDTATDVSSTADLSWTAGTNATSHDVYFGEDSTPDSTEFQGNQAPTTYDPGTMDADTTYYWRIDEVNGEGTTAGSVWSFTTAAAPPPTVLYPNDDCTVRGTTNYNATSPFGLFVKGSTDVSYIEFTTGGTTANSAELKIYHYWASVTANWDIVVKGAEYSFDETSFTGTDTSGWSTVGTIQDVMSVAFYTLDITTFYNNNLNKTVTLFLTRTSQPAGDGPIFEDREGTGTADGTTYGPRIDLSTGAAPPGQATNPNPSNGAGSVSVDADLDWTAGVGATSHDVYFGTDATPDTTEFKGNQGGTSYNPGTMDEDTVYYWRIDEVNAQGTTTGVVWTFSTATTPLVISNLSPTSYQVVYDSLSSNELMYIDRSYRYSYVPSGFQNCTYIRTANDDKLATGSSFMSFVINQDTTVYVAHDDRITSKPSWLTSGFTDSGYDITDDGGQAFSLYGADFSAGTVTLGGNAGTSASSMYTVVVEGPAGGGGGTGDSSVTFPGAVWTGKAASELGLNQTKLDQYASNVGGQGIIVRQGYVVKTWGDTAYKSDWASAAKPVISTMLFFAVEEGKLDDVDELIEDHGWSLITKDDPMTFYHLANMTSGYARGEAPGARWAYNDYAINLYAKTLFGNVYGITANAAATSGSRLGALQFQDGSIFSSREGNGLSTSVRDFARIGWLWCNYGYWSGQQLLPRWYFDEYMKAHVSSSLQRTSSSGSDYLGVGTYGGGSDQTADGPGVYGFNWWCNPNQSNWPDAPADTVQGNGHWGKEVITVIPSRSLVVAYKSGSTRGHTTGSSSSAMNQDLKLLMEACPEFPLGTIIVDPANPGRMVYQATFQKGGLKPVCFAGAGDPEDFFYVDTINNRNLLIGRGSDSTYITAVLLDFGGGNPGSGTTLDNNLNTWETHITTLENAGVITLFVFFDDSQPLTSNWQELVDKCVAKFKHHKLLMWMVAEEYGEALSTSQVSTVAARIKAQDDRHHVVGVHQNAGNNFNFASDNNLDMFVMQLNDTSASALHSSVKNSNVNGSKILNMAEAPDHATKDRTTVRLWNWACTMGGASAVQVIWMGRASDPSDWNTVDKYNDCSRLTDFMQSTKVNETLCRDDLARGNSDYVLADPGNVYIVYGDAGTSLGVNVQTGTYHIEWFDPVDGDWVDSGSQSLSAGDRTFTKPGSIGSEAVLYLELE